MRCPYFRPTYCNRLIGLLLLSLCVPLFSLILLKLPPVFEILSASSSTSFDVPVIFPFALEILLLPFYCTQYRVEVSSIEFTLHFFPNVFFVLYTIVFLLINAILTIIKSRCNLCHRTPGFL